MSSIRDPHRAPRAELAFLHAAHFACHYFLLVFPTAVIALAHERGLDYGSALALGAPVYVCFAMGTLPAGWMGDRWDRRILIGLFFAGCGAASVLVALAPNDLGLMAGLGLLGLFASIYHPVGLSMVTALSTRPGHALAVNGVFGNLGLAAASMLTGLLAAAFGWRSAFLAPGLVAIGVGGVYLRRRFGRSASVESPPAAAAVAGSFPSRLVQVRVVVVVMLAALFSGFVFNGVTVSLPKLLEERLGEDAAGMVGIGGYSAVVFAVAAFAQLPVGSLLDRFGGRPVLLALFTLEASTLTLMAQVGGGMVVPAALAAVTLMFAGIPVSGWLIGRYVAATWRSRAFALEYVLSLGMGAIVVPVMGLLHRTGYGFDWQYLFFAFSAGVVVLGALFIPKGVTGPHGRDAW